MVFFSLPDNENITKALQKKCNASYGEYKIHQFPDGETLIKINSSVQNKTAVIVCSLNKPNNKIITLYFFAKTLKELGAKHVCLVAPYLSYMRQDKQFNEGEGITSFYFAELLSSFVDSLITIDPHLHRISKLSDIYTIPTITLQTQSIIEKWVKKNVSAPLLIGPDEESEQWVSATAKKMGVPYFILNKTRKGDRSVKVSLPEIKNYSKHTPVLIDDIISTAKTMIQTVDNLKKIKLKKPICIGIHAVFARKAYNALLKAGVKEIITCNTISHPSNTIDVSELLADGLKKLSR